jgi:hypothetical protein
MGLIYYSTLSDFFTKTRVIKHCRLLRKMLFCHIFSPKCPTAEMHHGLETPVLLFFLPYFITCLIQINISCRNCNATVASRSDFSLSEFADETSLVFNGLVGHMDSRSIKNAGVTMGL